MAKKTLLERLRDATDDDERRKLIERIKQQNPFTLAIPTAKRQERVIDEPGDV